MIPQDACYHPGDLVQLTTPLRSDGSGGLARGTPLLAAGSRGVVIDVGLHLNRTLIYRVDFIAAGLVVGCRDVELQPVRGRLRLALHHQQQLLAAAGSELRVLAQGEQRGHYRVEIDDWQCELPERAFDWLPALPAGQDQPGGF